MFVDLLQETGRLLRIIQGAVQQSLRKTFDQRKRGAQFMTDIADEFRANILQFFQPRHVMEDK